MESVDLNPEFPVVGGEYRLTANWSVTLPGTFNRRLEDGSLVLWRPGFTIWTIVWDNPHGESKKTRCDNIKRDSSEARTDEREIDGDALLYSFRLTEEADDTRVDALYGFAFGDTGHVQMAFYFDDEDDAVWARKIWMSLREAPPASAPQK